MKYLKYKDFNVNKMINRSTETEKSMEQRTYISTSWLEMMISRVFSKSMATSSSAENSTYLTVWLDLSCINSFSNTPNNRTFLTNLLLFPFSLKTLNTRKGIFFYVKYSRNWKLSNYAFYNFGVTDCLILSTLHVLISLLLISSIDVSPISNFLSKILVSENSWELLKVISIHVQIPSLVNNTWLFYGFVYLVAATCCLDLLNRCETECTGTL